MDCIKTEQGTFELIRRTGDIWDRIYEDCLAAKSNIDFEQYILREDFNGRRFMELFIAKAEGGIKVRLLLDRVGCRSLYHSPLVKRLRAAGGKVHFYNPVGLGNLPFPRTWFPRNHLKTAQIDEDIVYAGGACFADYMREWQDMHLRIYGPYAKCIPFAWEQFTKKPPVWEDMHYIISTRGNNPAYRELLNRIQKAEKEILLATPYFIAPWRLEAALRLAMRRGVKVRMIMSEKTDVPTAMRVAQSYFPRLLKSGMEIFLFRDEVFHAKYMIVDETWATIGSTNIDFLSLYENREGNFIITDADIIRVLKEHYARDLERCRKIDENFWTGMKWTSRYYGVLMRSVKKIL